MTAPATQWDNDHDRLDEIRRQCHIAIVAKIDADPTLLAVPKFVERSQLEHIIRAAAAILDTDEPTQASAAGEPACVRNCSSSVCSA